jgi:Trk K+ transport system NAD-binding subunit/Kef-type K+ transport system membrane component KefB
MLGSYQPVLVFLASFAVLALAARQIGIYFARFELPLISGFLFAGVLVGPYVLGLIPAEAIEHLEFVDEVSLAFIAFAAGSELYLRSLRTRLRSIVSVTASNALIVPLMGSIATFILAPYIPFLAEMSTAGRIAVSLLAGAILVARSPSSAIAIVNEMRAKGPFTQTTLGVTMVSDVVVIVLFAIAVETADALLTDVGFSAGFIGLVLLELLISLGLGYLVARILRLILALHTKRIVKAGLILLAGYLVFVVALEIRHRSPEFLPFELFLEPLLIAMIGSFIVTNYTGYRDEFLKILEEIAPPVYVAFFTLTGASLALDVLAATWQIALILFLVRLVAIFVASFAGGTAAGDPARHNYLSWMAYVTQAGVGLGLATEVAVEFPGWGEEFATLIISVIVLSQIIGPPFYKWAIKRVGEAHTRATPHEFDGQRDALIFGIEGQSLLLARQLERHGWQVKLACLDEDFYEEIAATNFPIAKADLTLQTLHDLDAEEADAIVSMLSDDQNYQILELAYEHFGTDTLVVRLNDRENASLFHELGALVVEPGTAIVSLLDHFVRSPAATSLLLGMDGDQDLVEVEVRNPALHGMVVRDLRLPLDTLVLSVRRKGHTILSHGYTRLELGDHVSVVGSEESLEKVILRFDEQPRPSVPTGR